VLLDETRVTGIKPVLILPSVTTVTCFGGTSGRIALRAYNGTAEPTGPYTYLWDDGVTTPDRGNLPAGAYTVTDASGAYTVATIGVGQHPALTVVLNRTGNDLTPAVAGGVGPYTYLWSHGVTSATRPNVVGGVTYALTVTDANGCRTTASLRFELLRYWFSDNAIPLTLDAGDAYRADPRTKPGLRFACEVFVEPAYLSGTFERVGPVLEQPADSQGRTTFEVQELLEPYVDHHLPALGQSYPSRCEGLFRRFYLRHYERTDAGPGVAVALDDNYLVRGGLDYAEAGRGTWFSGYQDRVLPFPTWEPPTKTVLPDQPEYLCFMVPRAGITEARVYVRLTFGNGTSTEFLFTALFTPLRFEVYCLPAGFSQLRLAEYENAALQVRQWEVLVRDQDEAPVSEERTYVLTRRPVAIRRYFLYANSLGGTNTLLCRGAAQRTLATATLSAAVVPAAGYDPLAGDVRVDRKTGLATLKNYTGSRPAAQLAADQDFMLSERVVLLAGDRYLAGTVKDRTFTPADETETRHVLEFDFELPRNRFYTPAL
jgi:hypothetical protein